MHVGKKMPAGLSTGDSICPLTERPHEVKLMGDTTLRQCVNCQDVFESGGIPTSAVANEDAPGSDPLTSPAPDPIGTVTVEPGAEMATLSLTMEGLRKLAGEVLAEMGKTQLGTDIPHMIAFTMVGAAYLKRMGMDHNQVMEVVSVGYNGDVTGLFMLDFGPESESGEVPES